MFAGIFSCTSSFSPEINKVYLILFYLNYENINLKKFFDVALFVNSRRHNSADQLYPHCVVIIACLYHKNV